MLEQTLCISCKTPPFNQQMCSFGLKPLAVFTKCHTVFKPVPTLEFTAAQIETVNLFYKLFTSDKSHQKIITVAIYSKKWLCRHQESFENVVLMMLPFTKKRRITLRHYKYYFPYRYLWWMDEIGFFLRPFNSISVISRRWEGEHERLCAMKRRLGSGRISPPAGHYLWRKYEILKQDSFIKKFKTSNNSECAIQLPSNF